MRRWHSRLGAAHACWDEAVQEESQSLKWLQLPNAPLPMITADMNGDGCADGRDVQLFVNVVMGG